MSSDDPKDNGEHSLEPKATPRPPYKKQNPNNRGIDLKCPCGSLVKVAFKKPGIMKPSLEKVKCDGCESTLLVFIKRNQDRELRETGHVNVDIKILDMSDDLRLMLMEKSGEETQT